MNIRFATNDDLDWLVRAVAQMSRDFNEPRLLPDDPNYAAELWRHAIADHFALVAIDDRGKRAGLLLAWKGLHPFNPAIKTLTEALWYVERDHPKRAQIGLALMDAFVEFGGKFADRLFFSITRAGADSLRRRGFVEEEVVFSRWTGTRK
jgi:hypothetical protein